MDLRFRGVEASDEENAALDVVLGEAVPRDVRSVSGGHALRSQRHLLLPALHALNDRVGWISEGGLDEVCRRLMIPPAEAYGVASFYHLFSLVRRPAQVLWVCDDLACLLAEPFDPEQLQRAGAETRPSPCLGQCERAPAALLVTAGEQPGATAFAGGTATEPTPSEPAPSEPAPSEPTPSEPTAGGAPVPVRLSRPAGGGPGERSATRAPFPQLSDPGLVLLSRIGRADPSSIDDYRAHGGFEALRAARTLGPAGVIREVADSRLLGRGGAAFPAGRKWEAVARNPNHPHYLVCNADESEPGTFKDRVLMEDDPFAVVESIAIAAYATACERAWIYLRGEYPTARTRLVEAIAAARARGWTDHVEIEVFRGAGAYICGEETAIFNSIEGYRGEPRSKPPFPVDAGLFGQPTLVNNVETLVNVLPILRDGGVSYARVGTEGSTGTKLFCVSGRVAMPGVYEVPFGVTLRQLLDLAGGPVGTLRAVLLGGAAGTFVGPDQLDVPLTFEGTRAIGASLGSGVVMVLDDTVDVGRFLRRVAAFFRDESCGQCVPCRVGTVRQEEALERMAAGSSSGAEMVLLADLAQVMRDASICGLGQTAANAVQSGLALFGESGGIR